MDQIELKAFLDLKVLEYNAFSFIEQDPISIPHKYSNREDIEISAFFTATISWGQRKSIIHNALCLMELMENEPHYFIMNSDERDWERFIPFVHRTFNGLDTIYFLKALQNIYKNHGGIGQCLEQLYKSSGDLPTALMELRKIFFSVGDPGRTSKHFSDIARNSAAKRLNMFLRWMIRKDESRVDFGLWEGIPASVLFIPLDIHSGRVARKLGLLDRKQNDWKAVVELTENLRRFDPEDPVKYDYALFGLGVFEKF